MNQQQRKHVTKRISEIENAKIEKLNTDFLNNPENQIPHPPKFQYVDQREAVLALLGKQSSCHVRTIEELEEMEKKGELKNLQQLVVTPYEKEMDFYNKAVRDINERKKNQINSKVYQIKADARAAIDIIIFGNNEVVLKVLKDFEKKVY